ncbi:MAG: TetR/AcrR family transcriptional regulator [Clostridium sp.]
MKREEKNQQMRRRIMDSALAEFSGQDYGASSVNNICSAQGISKGIIYHYFKTKDELFLACVKECFSLLTAYLSERMQQGEGTPGAVFYMQNGLFCLPSHIPETLLRSHRFAAGAPERGDSELQKGV